METYIVFYKRFKRNCIYNSKKVATHGNVLITGGFSSKFSFTYVKNPQRF